MRQQQFTVPADGRSLIVACPETLDEFNVAYEIGYVVSTTAEQREQWGLDPFDRVPVLPTEDALRVLFAGEDDPILEEFDPALEPDPMWTPDDPSAPDVDRVAALHAERQLDARLTVRASQELLSGALPAVPSLADAPAPLAQGA